MVDYVDVHGQIGGMLFGKQDLTLTRHWPVTQRRRWGQCLGATLSGRLSE
jgi:hypothetical protein